MQLASKESDIEQLRAKLLDLSDSTSVASFPSADETDGNLPGKNISIQSVLLISWKLVCISFIWYSTSCHFVHRSLRRNLCF